MTARQFAAQFEIEALLYHGRRLGECLAIPLAPPARRLSDEDIEALLALACPDDAALDLLEGIEHLIEPPEPPAPRPVPAQMYFWMHLQMGYC